MAHFTMVLRLFLCMFVAQRNISATIDISAEALKELDMLGIKCPTPNEKMVAKNFAYRLHQEVAKKDATIDKKDETIAAINRQLEATKTEKKQLQGLCIRRTPPTLMDSIEETYEPEYRELMESYRRKLDQLRKEEEDLTGSITNSTNESVDPNLSEMIKNITKDYLEFYLEPRLEELHQEIEELEKKLPPKISQEDTRGNRIAKRRHLWKWIIENKKDERKVDQIWKYVKKWYDTKEESFKKEYTISDYLDQFCHNMGSIHEASTDAAQALERIPLQRGYEFEVLRIYGDDELDESVTILVNAVGLSHAFCDVHGTTELPHPEAMTQTVSV